MISKQKTRHVDASNSTRIEGCKLELVSRSDDKIHVEKYVHVHEAVIARADMQFERTYHKNQSVIARVANCKSDKNIYSEHNIRFQVALYNCLKNFQSLTGKNTVSSLPAANCGRNKLDKTLCDIFDISNATKRMTVNDMLEPLKEMGVKVRPVKRSIYAVEDINALYTRQLEINTTQISKRVDSDNWGDKTFITDSITAINAPTISDTHAYTVKPNAETQTGLICERVVADKLEDLFYLKMAKMNMLIVVTSPKIEDAVFFSSKSGGLLSTLDNNTIYPNSVINAEELYNNIQFVGWDDLDNCEKMITLLKEVYKFTVEDVDKLQMHAYEINLLSQTGKRINRNNFVVYPEDLLHEKEVAGCTTKDQATLQYAKDLYTSWSVDKRNWFTESHKQLSERRHSSRECSASSSNNNKKICVREDGEVSDDDKVN